MAATQKRTGGDSTPAKGGKRTAAPSAKGKNTAGSRSATPAPLAPRPYRREVGAAVCLLLAIFSAFGYFNMKAIFKQIFQEVTEKYLTTNFSSLER